MPLYNIDKIFHGLRDAYDVAGSDKAKQMLFKLGEWFLATTAKLTDEQVQQMLYSEHGGLNDVFAGGDTMVGGVVENLRIIEGVFFYPNLNNVIYKHDNILLHHPFFLVRS